MVHTPDRPHTTQHEPARAGAHIGAPRGERRRPAPQGRPTGPGQKGETQATRLVKLALAAGARPFATTDGAAFLEVPATDGARSCLPLSRAAGDWLRQQLWDRERQAAGAKALTEALAVLAAQALGDAAAPRELGLRVVWHGGAIWYDLRRGDHCAVRVAPLSEANDSDEPWEVHPSPALFRRHTVGAAQVLPERTPGGRLPHLLGDFLNASEPHDALLLAVWLVTALVPDIAHPILAPFGPAGSAKTTLLRLGRRLVDPSAAEVLTMPRDSERLPQMLQHHYAPAFDNLSALSVDQSDALCRAVTGDADVRRALYTDDDDVVRRYRRPVMLSGINVVAQRPDLLDRCLLVQLRSIATDERRPEHELWARFEAERPRILGAMLSALSGAMAGVADVDLPSAPRLADFARWGVATAEAIGWSGAAFLAAYRGTVARQVQEAIAAHPVGQAMVELLKLHPDGWEGPPQRCLGDLKAAAERLGIDTSRRPWPNTPHWLGRRLRDVAHNLESLGWRVDLDGATGDHERLWSFRRPGLRP